MWLIIANLPIAVRQSYPNMTLAALYAGSQKPIWSEVDKVLDLSVINRAHDLNIRGQVVHTDFKLIYLVADMVTKANILNHMQFNGRFGCPLCYCQGQSGDDGNGWFYSLCTTLDLRSRISYLEDIRIAEESRQTWAYWTSTFVNTIKLWKFEHETNGRGNIYPFICHCLNIDSIHDEHVLKTCTFFHGSSNVFPPKCLTNVSSRKNTPYCSYFPDFSV